MQFETLKRSHLKRNIMIGVVAVAIISAIILNFTRAKYRVTQSIPLVNGTINYSPGDIIISAYFNDELMEKFPAKEDGYIVENVTCDKEASATFNEDAWEIEVTNLVTKGTKCDVTFREKVPAKETILANHATILTRNDFSTTVTDTITGTIYKSLDETQYDNDGEVYYFAGNPTDNWVKFANKYWRIIRINGNGSIRLIYSGNNEDDMNNLVNTTISDAQFNSKQDDNAYVGFLYGNTSTWKDGGRNDHTGVLAASMTREIYYGTGYTFNSKTGEYSLSGTIKKGLPGKQFIGYYTCSRDTTSGTCISLSYINGEHAIVGNTYNYSIYSYERVNNYSTNYDTTHKNSNWSIIAQKLNNWYTSNLNNYVEYLDNITGFCGDREVYSGRGTAIYETVYGANNRLALNKAPSLKCTNDNDLYTITSSSIGNKVLKYPIGLITADEVAYAGGVWNLSNEKYFLYNEKNNWTMTPSAFSGNSARVFRINKNGSLDDYPPANNGGIRPVINLKADVILTGLGTVDEPYVVKGAE